jgi:hypothetical protein
MDRFHDGFRAPFLAALHGLFYCGSQTRGNQSSFHQIKRRDHSLPGFIKLLKQQMHPPGFTPPNHVEPLVHR